MSLKSHLKETLFGPPGIRPRQINHGLLKGLRFNVNASVKSMRLLGLDEREITADVVEFGLRAVCALDIGSNDGWYALYFASCPGIRKVYAFEPALVHSKVFEENFALNDPGFLAKVERVAKFVGQKNEGEWCSIDQFLPDLPRPAIFKIDVDGGELDVLKGAERTLAAGGCLIVLETHSADLERDCGSFLRGLGYKTRIVNNGWYRAIVPETRNLPHNRWMIASR